MRESPGPGGEPVRLTGFSHGAGCGCELAAAEVRAALASMTVASSDHADLRVGPAMADDDGVYRITDDLALVQTVDFSTPVVDDAFTWGRIAAANALSDVYARGGRPVTALSIVAWPRDALPWSLLGRVLDGATTVLVEAGCPLVGGHSIDDPEPKFGLSVTGLVDPARLLTSADARPGDVLVLTKALGTGVLTTALKRGVPTDLDAAVASMTTSNAAASEVAVGHRLRAATDVTGFGLIGHLTELVTASGVGAEIRADALPALPGAWAAIDAGAVSGGTSRNLADTAHVDWANCPGPVRVLACDAQTSGGLLLAVPPDRIDAVLAALRSRAVPATEIGTLVEAAGDADPGRRIRVR